tara:strand:+ start:666 stop:1370 length:705 start_codon:yes stop_codon:yes gene_type:complete
MSIKLIMPMAGEGNRFKEKGYDLPKPLVPVKGIPMFQYTEQQIGIDFDERIFIVRKDHNIASTIRQFIKGATIIELDEPTEGTACTLYKAKHLFEEGDGVFVANCDQSVQWDSNKVNSIIQDGVDGLIATFIDAERNPKWSFAKTEADKVVEVAEKKAISDRATVGYYYWRDANQMFRNIDQMIEADDRVNGEFYTCPVYNYTIKEGANVCAFDVVSMQGIGTPEDLESYLNEN